MQAANGAAGAAAARRPQCSRLRQTAHLPSTNAFRQTACRPRRRRPRLRAPAHMRRLSGQNVAPCATHPPRQPWAEGANTQLLISLVARLHAPGIGGVNLRHACRTQNSDGLVRALAEHSNRPSTARVGPGQPSCLPGLGCGMMILGASGASSGVSGDTPAQYPYSECQQKTNCTAYCSCAPPAPRAEQPRSSHTRSMQTQQRPGHAPECGQSHSPAPQAGSRAPQDRHAAKRTCLRGAALAAFFVPVSAHLAITQAACAVLHDHSHPEC